MKVLFILDDSTLGQEPLGSMYLAAALKAAGHAAEAINGEAHEDLVEEVRKRNPGLVAFSSTTGLHTLHLGFARRIKAEMDVPTIMGNTHPSFFPEVLEEEDSLDFICRGEGDFALVELVEALEGRGDPTKIPNIDAKQNGTVTRNELRCFNQDLDDVPFPDRPMTRHLREEFVDGTSHVITGRGCPYNCSYCFNHTMRGLAEGKYVRRRSVDNVMAEIRAVIEENRPRFINFQDDTFILNKPWVEEFCARYGKECGLPFLCHVRADLVDERVGHQLGDAGCVVAVLGLESGNDYLRNEILHRNLSREQIVRACRILRDKGIEILTQNMAGIPYETVGTLFDTVALNRACKPLVMQINLYEPYPRQELTELAIREGLFDGNYNAIPRVYYREPLSLNLRDKTELEWLSPISNLLLDSRLVFWSVRLLMMVLPRNNGLKEKALDWLSRHQDGVRRRLRCPDSRWAPLSKFWAPRH